MSTETTRFEIDSRAAEYYQRPTYTLDGELEAARERIDEWSYDEDAHGYCHERTGWVALVNGVEALRAELEAARPVVEAAVAWRDTFVHTAPALWDQPAHALLDAVDLYRSATSDHPSTTEEKP